MHFRKLTEVIILLGILAAAVPNCFAANTVAKHSAAKSVPGDADPPSMVKSVNNIYAVHYDQQLFTAPFLNYFGNVQGANIGMGTGIGYFTGPEYVWQLQVLTAKGHAYNNSNGKLLLQEQFVSVTIDDSYFNGRITLDTLNNQATIWSLAATEGSHPSSMTKDSVFVDDDNCLQQSSLSTSPVPNSTDSTEWYSTVQGWNVSGIGHMTSLPSHGLDFYQGKVVRHSGP